MLFRSSGKFIDEVTDSFNRFGIKTKLAEKGSNSVIQKFQMFDDIHDSNYVAIGMDKPSKDPKSTWENVIKNELIPTLNNSTNKGTNPASALIVPSKDIDIVEELLRKKGLSPSVYQLFPGFVVAGISKDDTASLVAQAALAGDDLPKKADEKINSSKDNIPNKKLEDNSTKNYEKTSPIKNEGNNLADVLNKLDDDKVKDVKTKSPSQNKKDEEMDFSLKNKNPNNIKEKNQESDTDLNTKKNNPTGKKSPIGKKLLATALLGTAIGAGAIGGPAIVDKATELAIPKNDKLERNILKDATDTYFQDIIDGSPEDKELLKIISENPNLAQNYINELADSPIKVNALKNPNISPNELVDNHNSTDPKIRSSVAENPSTPSHILDNLMKDNDTDVLKSLAKNPSLPEEHVNELSNYSGLHNSLLENSNLKPNTLGRIVSENTRNCDFNKLYMANPCLSIEEILYHKNNDDECVQAGLAMNPNTPSEMLEDFIKHKNPDIRNAALKNKNLPESVINEVFPPNWVTGTGGSDMEEKRMQVLENPNINPKILEKATFINPDKYNKPVARNKNTPTGLANKIKNYAQGNNGVKNFLKSGNSIAQDPVKLRQLENQMRNNGSLEAPLKRMINKDFAEKVYDPYTFINGMRKLQPKNDSHKINVDNNTSVLNNYMQYTTPTVLDQATEAPADFSKLPLPPVTPGDISYNPEAEMAALSTANNIVDDLMKDVIEDVRASINNPSFNPGRGSDVSGNTIDPNINTPNQNMNDGVNVDTPDADYSLFQGNTSSDNKKEPLTYKNACTQIKNMYDKF